MTAAVLLAAFLASCGTAGTAATGVDDNNGLAPSWSPDGRSIVFARDYQLFVVNADGTGLRSLTRDAALKRDPVWSPTGAEIAYVVSDVDTNSSIGGTYECGVIFVVRVDGSGRRRLSPPGASDCNPFWSPDGTHLAFNSFDGSGSPGSLRVGSLRCGHRLEGGMPQPPDTQSLYVMTAKGTDRRQIAYRPNGFDGVAWSPDGARLAFDDFDASDLCLSNVRGSRSIDIASALPRPARSEPFGPLAWSPNGRWLAVEVGAQASDPAVGLYLVRADGKEAHRVAPYFGLYQRTALIWLPSGTKLAVSADAGLYLVDLRRHTTRLVRPCQCAPAISPDGTKIVYQTDAGLYVVGIDGRGARTITVGVSTRQCSWDSTSRCLPVP